MSRLYHNGPDTIIQKKGNSGGAEKERIDKATCKHTEILKNKIAAIKEAPLIIEQTIQSSIRSDVDSKSDSNFKPLPYRDGYTDFAQSEELYMLQYRPKNPNHPSRLPI